VPNDDHMEPALRLLREFHEAGIKLILSGENMIEIEAPREVIDDMIVLVKDYKFELIRLLRYGVFPQCPHCGIRFIHKVMDDVKKD